MGRGHSAEGREHGAEGNGKREAGMMLASLYKLKGRQPQP